ncbi:MAG: hypothetical protein HY898_32155 [Deltaproteobacteria bacterium]|nr:hypothetical protein [Deltaproteobacteria bacterium]
MSIDLDTIPAEVRTRLIAIGRQFGSADTLSQAEATLQAGAAYGQLLEEHGFVAADLERLREARDALRATGAADEPPASARKLTSLEYVRAMRDGKTLRQQARAILHIIMQRLTFSEDPVQHEAARSVSSSLDQTQSSRGDAVRLAAQLDQLRATLTMARVEAMAAKRGGPGLVPRLAHTAERLRATHADRRGTEQGDRIDLVDGIIVELVRDARRASRSAARALGRPEIAGAFELIRLYGVGRP